jgi:tetratricopeptide (TPR) repeat protein
MASTTNKLKDPNLSEQEQDAIIGAFVRRHENELLRQRWEEKLVTEHGVSKQFPARKRSVTIRKIGIAIMAIAASLLLFFVVMPQLNQPRGEALLATYISEISIDNTRGTTGTDVGTLRRRVADAFNDGDYAAAVGAGESLAQLPDALPEDELNLGKAYLRNANFERAEQALRGLVEQATDYTTEARYTLALSLLSQRKTTEAVAELRKISAADGAKIYQKARSLIDEFG